MIQIVDMKSNGKTRKLLTYAKENKCTVVCKYPERMVDKAVKYNLGYVECISYDAFFAMYRYKTLPAAKYVIDELAEFASAMFDEDTVFEGYNLSVVN